MKTIDKTCPICGRDVEEYRKGWSCYRFHKWQHKWRQDKSTEKYKDYLAKRKKSMEDAARKRLEKLNKKCPAIYKSRDSRKLK